MTAEELIKELQKLPPKNTVYYKYGKVLCPVERIDPNPFVKEWVILTINEGR